TPLQLCYSSIDTRNQGKPVTLAIQGVNKKLYKQVIDGYQGELPFCTPSIPSGLPSGSQVFFSVYADDPLPGVASFEARFGGALIVPSPVERYHPDKSKPTITKFPFIGLAEPMAGGFHDLYAGTWNGNNVFDETLITAAGNDSYQPLRAGPLPADAPSAMAAAPSGDTLEFLGIGDI